ncbi:hypothetical protein KUTeg_007312 [Tegillarca granosa]|uniref:Uncharacterized protein n=1 Tax=Tegillarca granosa TaxID=220873 RepID=A0ABQ9FH06_TEGGR|nr:hypothetical protein KUTeg_007312 [Tegillarca granosa]
MTHYHYRDNGNRMNQELIVQNGHLIVDQKPLAVESTQDLENARAENETAAPEDIERSEESSNEGLDAYFQEMQLETPPSLEETMRFELMRLKSFWSFPRNIDVSPIMLAKWGFYYTGNSAETRCFCCAASYRNWEDNDNPQQVHQRISPYCPFIAGTDVRNVSIYRSDDRPSTTQVSSESSSSRLVTPSAETQSREQGSRQNTNRSTGQRGDFDLSDFSYRAPETVATTPPAAASTSTGVPQAVSAVSNQQTTSVSTTTSTLTGATASSSTAPPASSTSTANSNTASVTSSITAKPSDAVSIATTSTTSASASAASNINSGHSGNTVATTTGDLTSVPGQARSSSTSRANTASSQSGASPATQQRYDPLGINFDRPRYPSYAVLSNRTASFAAWPQYLRAGREMALAGFFYAGGLRNWDAQDDPWHEHAKWFPRCAFVRMNKGEKYVNTIQNELEEMERERAQGNTTVHQVDETTQGENLEELDATVLMHIILDEIESSPTTEQPPSASGRGPLLAESRSKIKEFGSSDSAISSNEDEASASGGIGAKSDSKSSRKRKSKRKKS